MRRPNSFLLAGLLAVTLMVSGCGGGASSEPVAKVNETTITKVEYDRVYNELKKSMNIDETKLPEDPQQKAIIMDYLKTLTINKLVVLALVRDAAAKDGVTVTDEDLAQFKKDMFEKAGMKDEFQTYLQKNQLTEADFDHAIRESLLLDKFVEKNGAQQVAVSQTEIQNLYKTNQADLKVPERIQAKHILVGTNVGKIKKDLRAQNPSISDPDLQKAVDKELQARKALAEDLRKQIQANPAQFGELAKTKSDDKFSGAKGGELGLMAQQEIEPQFWAGLDSAPVGKLAPGVVESPLGFHIVMVEKKDPAHVQTLAESNELLRRYLTDQKRQVWLQEWLTKQKATAKIEVFPKYKPAQPQPGMPAGAPGTPPTAGQAPGAPQQ